MELRCKIVSCLTFLCACGSGALWADDWPQWQGPHRDGIWRETGIVEKFPPDGPPVLWRAAVGAGYSGPTVAAGRVYVTDRWQEKNPAEGSERGSGSKERVLCFGDDDAKLLWKHEYDCRYAISYPAGPRVAPLVRDGRVYTLGAEGELRCLDAANGSLVWSRSLKQDFQIKAPMWGFAGHPLLDGHRLICLVGGPGSTVVAFDRRDGKEIWRALTAAEPGYSSPVLIEAGGKRQLILFHPEAANSLDPETGRLYWSIPFKSNTGLSVATPRQLGDLLFFTSFYNGAMAVRLDKAAPSASLVWSTQRASERDTIHLNAILCTPFLEAGHIYGVCSYGQLRCLKAETGERVWQTFKATTAGEAVRWANAFLVKNADRFFLFNEQGELILARLTPQGYQEVCRARVIEPTNKDCGRLVVWSHPAFANRHCYIRNDKELLCLDLAAQ